MGVRKHWKIPDQVAAEQNILVVVLLRIQAQEHACETVGLFS